MKEKYNNWGNFLCKVLEPLKARYILVLVVLGLQVQFAVAQDKITVTGSVKSKATDEPLPGVNVIIKGTTSGTVTDFDGKFSLEAGADAILMTSYIGYQMLEVPVNGRNFIGIALDEDINQLEEIVVVGYGEMKRSSLSSAQLSISSKDIEQANAMTLDQALQGRAAGVYVTRNTGQPGGAISVNIRGVNSISSSTEPMYVIDGVQIMGSTNNTTNPLAGINPDDIESMEVLLGPTATAIYGSRAANGVVVITTKRGKMGETKINYNFLYSLQDTPDFLPTMNLREYATYMNEWSRVTGNGPDPMFQDPSLLGEGTNWQKELFQQVPMMRHQVALSGGTEKTTFYLSAEYLNQEGIAIGSGFDRYSFRLNMDNQTRKWLKVGTNLMMSRTAENLAADNDIINTAISQSPAVAVRNPDGSWGGPESTQFMLSNPVALATINDNRLQRWNGLGGVYAEIKPLEGLSLRTEFNGNVGFNRDYFYSPSYQFGGFVKDQTEARRGSSQSTYWNFLVMAQYNKKFGDHEIGLMASHEAQESTWENVTGSRAGFVTNNIQELAAGDPTTSSANSSRNNWGMESYFGRANYMFKEKYILQGTLRADGSPNFGPNNRWGYFPAVSAAWKISEENMFKGIRALDNLKLRAEYGITGNQNSGGPAHFSRLNPWPTPWGTGFLVSNFSNPDFQWEQTTSYNVGLDINLFNNRVEIIADAYLKQVDNLMMPLPLPGYMGTTGVGSISPPWINVGAMENKGVGLTVNTVNVQGPIQWRSGVMFSVDRNALTNLYTESSILDRSPWFMDQFISRSVVGQPVWQFYGYESMGIFQSLEEVNAHPSQATTGLVDERQGTWVGDVKFRDINNDGYVNELDRDFIGNPWPKFTFGLNNTVSYKNFELNVFLQGVYGNQIFNFARFRNENPNGSGPGRGFLQSVSDFARVATSENGNPFLENPNTRIPRINTADPNNNQRPSDSYVEDGSYLRVQNVTLSYRLPERLLSSVPVAGMTVSLGGQNLFTFTNYKGYDPEVGMFVLGANQTVAGIDYGRYPLTRVYNFSLSVDF